MANSYIASDLDLEDDLNTMLPEVIECIKLLLTFGLDLDVANQSGDSVLHIVFKQLQQVSGMGNFLPKHLTCIGHGHLIG